MPVVAFDRDSTAKWHARQHLKTDPAIRSIYYLPDGSPEREIRFVEVNEMIAERDEEAIEPFRLGIDHDTETAHTLLVLDVTPAQWERIKLGSLKVPQGWSLSSLVQFNECK